MDKSIFVAQTDLQIGDKIRIAYGFHHDFEYEIHDIRTIHYLKSGTVNFEFQLINKNGDLSDWLPRGKLIPIK